MTVKRVKTKDSRTGKVLDRFQVIAYMPTDRGRDKRVRQLHETKRAAQRAERALQEEAALRRAGVKKVVERSNAARKAPKLVDFVPRFMAHQEVEENTPATLSEKEGILRVHLLVEFGELRLDEINEPRIAEYRVKKRKQEKLAAKTVGNHMAVLHRLLTVAKDWGEIDRVPTIPLPQKKDLVGKPIEFLDFEEADAYLGMVERFYQWEDHLYVLLALRSGLRTGEMRALQWSQIRLREGFVLVDRSITDASYKQDVERGIRDNPGVHLPKWKKIRQVALPWDVVEALKVAKTRAQSALVFPGSMIGGFRSRSSIEKVICRAAERGKLGKHVHPHMLRHTYASHLVMRGVNLRVVQELLGHATLEMTMRYAHLTTDHKADAVQVLAQGRGLRVLEGGEGPRGGREVAGKWQGRRA